MEQKRLESLQRQGVFATKVNFVGIQVPAPFGIQGWGVKTPKAAAVAAATWGLAREVHMPKPLTFTNGAVSFMVAMGFPPARFVTWLVTFNVPGAVPKGQVRVAPATTKTLKLSPP
jgi:hypothetical protein